MATKAIHVSPQGITTELGWQTLNWAVRGADAECFVLSHSQPQGDSFRFGDPGRGDHALVAVLLYAMQRGSDIVVEGRVSARLLDGIETLQAIWHRWRPSRYKMISIRAHEESEAVPKYTDLPAVFAFSGGVDSCYSLFRHLQHAAGRQTRRPSGALFVHGMDIPLERDDFYRNAAQRAEAVLADTGVPLIRMKSNSRNLGQNWEDSFGLQLAACFLVLQEHFAFAVKGSEEPYEVLIPWGSTPLTDPFCSTAILKLEHDGCESDRTEKVRWLAANTLVCENLRVCWAGPNLDRNCGECEKCLRTMLNFWASNIEIPKAFPTSLTPERILSISWSNELQKGELENLLRHAARHHPDNDPILKALRRQLGHTGPRALARKAFRTVQKLLRI